MGHWGPWVQDPDITVAAGHALAYTGGFATSSFTHSGAYTLSDVNDTVQNDAIPALLAGITENPGDAIYTYSPTADPVISEINVALTRTAATGSLGSYTVGASLDQQVLYCSPFPHDWTPPPGAEVDGDPVVITGHVELLHTQQLHATRSPAFNSSADLKVYKHPATTDAHIDTGPRVLVDTHPTSYVDSGSPPVFRTIVDLAGNDLYAVLFNSYFGESLGVWSFSSDYATTDNLRARVDTTTDPDTSYYVWRPPRYRLFIDDGIDTVRQLWPRTDSNGPAIGRVYPTPDTPQYGRRFGSAAPL